MKAEPRSWYEKRNYEQRQKYQELQWGSAKQLSDIDGLRSVEGRIPSRLTRDSARLASDIARSRQPQIAAPAPANTGSAGLAFDSPAPANVGSVGRAEDQGSSFFGSLKDILSAVDRPISERLGWRIPDAPGPFDEILNVGLEEVTRPTNWAAALAGGPLASGIARAGRGTFLARPALVASRFALPFGHGRGPVARIGAEAAVAGAGRVAGEKGYEAMPEGAPEWARLGAGLGAGLLGGVGTASALGKTVLRPPRIPEPGMKIQFDEEEFSKNVPDLVKEEFSQFDMKGAPRGTLESLFLPGTRAAKEGKEPARDITEAHAFAKQSIDSRRNVSKVEIEGILQNSGFTFDSQWRIPALKGIDPSIKGAPTLPDVMARQPIYQNSLTSQQISAMDKLDKIVRDSMAIPESLRPLVQRLGLSENVLPGILDQEINYRGDLKTHGGRYMPRGPGAPPGEKRFNVGQAWQSFQRVKKDWEHDAKHPSQAFGMDKGTKYVSPAEAVSSLVSDNLNTANDVLAAARLLTMTDEGGKRVASHRIDRMDPKLQKDMDRLRASATNLRRTLADQLARLGVTERIADRYDRAVMEQLDLDSRAAAKLGEIEKTYSPSLQKDAWKHYRSTVRESISLAEAMAKRSQAVQRELIKAGKIKESKKYKEIVDEHRKVVEEAKGATTRTRQDVLRARARRLLRSQESMAKRATAIEERAGISHKAFALRQLAKHPPKRLGRKKGFSDTPAPRAGRSAPTHYGRGPLKTTGAASRRFGTKFADEGDTASEIEAGLTQTATMTGPELFTELRRISTSEMAEADRAVRVAGDITSKFNVATAEKNLINKQLEDAKALADRGNADAQKLLARIEGTRKKLKLTDDEIEALRPFHERAKAAAAEVPKGSARILIAGLEPYSFAEDVALEAGKYVRDDAGRFGTLRAINSFSRALQATGEMSYLGIQLAIAIATNPRVGIPAARASMAAWLNSGAEVMPVFYNEFDAKALAGFDGRRKRTVAGWAKAGTRMAGDQEELAIGSNVPEFIKKFGENTDVERLSRPLRSIIERADRGYRTAGNTARLGLASAEEDLWLLKNPGKEMPDDVARKIAETVNRATGWTPQRAFGDWGEVTQFAPRYLAARVRTLGQLASKDPYKRQMARRLAGKFIAMGVMATMASNALKDPDKEGTFFGTDLRPFSGKAGPTFNPLEAEYKNPNFMRITDVAGRDWSLLAGMDALLALQIGLTSLVTNPTGDPSEITGRARQLLSAPLFSAGIDWMIEKENFEGDELKLDTRAGQMDILRRFVPFAVPDLAESAVAAQRTAQTGDVGTTAAEVAGGVAQGFFGGRGTPATTRERIERGDTAGFTAGEEFEALKPQAWDRTKKRLGRENIGRYGNFGQWWRAQEKKLLQDLRRRYRGRKPEAEIYDEVEKEIRKSRVYTRYMEERRRLTDAFIRANPQEALDQWTKSVTATGFDKWTPTKEQKSLMIAYARRTGQLAR